MLSPVVEGDQAEIITPDPSPRVYILDPATGVTPEPSPSPEPPWQLTSDSPGAAITAEPATVSEIPEGPRRLVPTPEPITAPPLTMKEEMAKRAQDIRAKDIAKITPRTPVRPLKPATAGTPPAWDVKAWERLQAEKQREEQKQQTPTPPRATPGYFGLPDEPGTRTPSLEDTRAPREIFSRPGTPGRDFHGEAERLWAGQTGAADIAGLELLELSERDPGGEASTPLSGISVSGETGLPKAPTDAPKMAPIDLAARHLFSQPHFDLPIVASRRHRLTWVVGSMFVLV